MPLSLNDDEYNAVQAAAAPIHPLQRDAFLKALAVELERHPVVGPGLVHCVAAGAEPGPGPRSPAAGRSQLLEPLALCNARLDRQQSGRET